MLTITCNDNIRVKLFESRIKNLNYIEDVHCLQTNNTLIEWFIFLRGITRYRSLSRIVLQRWCLCKYYSSARTPGGSHPHSLQESKKKHDYCRVNFFCGERGITCMIPKWWIALIIPINISVKFLQIGGSNNVAWRLASFRIQTSIFDIGIKAQWGHVMVYL